MNVLEVRNLKVYYKTPEFVVKAVDNVSLNLREKETVGLVGESGCGKTTFGFSLLKILPKNAVISGEIKIAGEDIVNYDEKRMRSIRGRKIGMIFQDPMTSLNPIMKIKDMFEETIKTHYPEKNEEEIIQMTKEALEDVGIDSARMNEYPFQFSGGMRQRLMIALTLVLKPKIVIADEPTTSLDVVVQAQIIEVMKKLKKEHDMSMILITHDMGVVAELADKIGVMYAGHLVEFAESEKIYYFPKHPYTQALLKSIPNTNLNDMNLKYIPGSPPDLANPPKGCRFAPRCEYAKKICFEKEPPLYKTSDGTLVKCWLYEKEGEEIA